MYSCCNTRNSNYAVSTTPETTTTQLLQHQKQQLRSCYSQQPQPSKACYFATARNNKRQPSEERSRGMIKQLSKASRTQLPLLKSGTAWGNDKGMRGSQEDGQSRLPAV